MYPSTGLQTALNKMREMSVDNGTSTISTFPCNRSSLFLELVLLIDSHCCIK